MAEKDRYSWGDRPERTHKVKHIQLSDLREQNRVRAEALFAWWGEQNRTKAENDQA